MECISVSLADPLGPQYGALGRGWERGKEVLSLPQCRGLTFLMEYYRLSLYSYPFEDLKQLDLRIFFVNAAFYSYLDC